MVVLDALALQGWIERAWGSLSCNVRRMHLRTILLTGNANASCFWPKKKNSWFGSLHGRHSFAVSPEQSLLSRFSDQSRKLKNEYLLHKKLSIRIGQLCRRRKSHKFIWRIFDGMYVGNGLRWTCNCFRQCWWAVHCVQIFQKYQRNVIWMEAIKPHMQPPLFGGAPLRICQYHFDESCFYM